MVLEALMIPVLVENHVEPSTADQAFAFLTSVLAGLSAGTSRGSSPPAPQHQVPPQQSKALLLKSAEVFGAPVPSRGSMRKIFSNMGCCSTRYGATWGWGGGAGEHFLVRLRAGQDPGLPTLPAGGAMLAMLAMALSRSLVAVLGLAGPTSTLS